MRTLRRFFSKLTALFSRRRAEEDFTSEVSAHLALMQEDLERQGMSPDQARRAARLKLGGVQQTRELYREARSFPWIESLWQDVRFGCRVLRKNPGFTAVAITTLALAIGANTAIFSVVNAVLLKQLPFPDAQRIVVLGGNAGPVLNTLSESPTGLLGWRPHVQSLEAAAAYQPGDVNVSGVGEPETVLAAQVSPDFFRVLGIAPLLGDAFYGNADTSPSGVVLSWDLWQRRYSADPYIIGKPIEINAQPAVIRGVTPRSFQFPERAEIWVPQGVGDDTIDRGVRWSNLIGRLRPGVSLAQAQAEMDAISSRARARDKLLNRLHANATLSQLQDNLAAKSRKPLLLLLGAVAGVLLIASVNIANLALCRAVSRQRELAVRSSIGAGRTRLIRQLLTESALLALCGAVLGAALAFATLRPLVAMLPLALPRLTPISIDVRVFAYTALACAVVAALSGLLPAIGATRLDLSNPLQKAPSMSAGVSHARIRSTLLAAQVALSLILLIGAGLMARTLDGLLNVPSGFDAANVLTLNIPVSQAAYPTNPQVVAYYGQAFARLRSLPGIDSVGAVNYLPLGGTPFFLLPISTSNSPLDKIDPFHNGASFFTVAGDYFQAMRIPLLRGRYFADADNATVARVAIVSENVGRRFWPAEDPIGKQFDMANETLTVVGEVGDVHHASLEQSGELEVYFPQGGMPTRVMDVVVRFAGSSDAPDVMIPTIRSAILSVDKNQPIASMQTMATVVGRSISSQQSDAFLLETFSLLALILAVIGCYGVTAYSVAQRTQELGIRMALGAQPRHILRLAVSRGMIATLIGICVGIAGALALTRLMSSLLFGITPNDPLTFVAAATVLLLMAFTACYIPARRAIRVDPMETLRHE